MTKTDNIQIQISITENRILNEQRGIDNMRDNLSRIVTGGSDYDLATHGASYIRHIEEGLRKISEAKEQIKLLRWALEA